MVKQSTHPTGWWRLLYWWGRGLQAVGLLLIWWVLLLFASVAAMGILLRWSLLAVGVFYAGWACAVWARKSCG